MNMGTSVSLSDGKIINIASEEDEFDITECQLYCSTQCCHVVHSVVM